MAKNYILDTSAIFSYIKAENGSDTIERLLNSAQKGRENIFISFISFMELYYISWQEKGEEAAKELAVLVDALPVERVESSPRLTLSAGRIKATHKLSVADAFVAATALEKDAILIHKDPEFETLSSLVATIKLPYKHS